MSEAKPNGQADESTTESVDEVKDPKAVLAKNQELLAKLKSVNDKLKAIADENNSLKTEKLGSEGKKDELIDSLKTQLSEAKKREAQIGWSVVSSQVATEAVKKGCVNPDVLMKVVDFGSAGIDTNSYQVAKDDINIILEKAVKDHPYLFKTDTKKPKDGGIGSSVDTAVSYDKMSKDELLASYREAALKQQGSRR